MVAVNALGESPMSLVGKGAAILVIPDAPLNLQVESASDTSITFSWQAAVSDSAILDYIVYQDQGKDDFVVAKTL